MDNKVTQVAEKTLQTYRVKHVAITNVGENRLWNFRGFYLAALDV